MHVFSNALHESTNPTHLSALNRKFSLSSSPSRKCVGCKTRGHVSDGNNNKCWLPHLDDRVRVSTSSPFLPTHPDRTAELLGRSSLFLVPSPGCVVILAWSWVTTFRYPFHLGHGALQRFRPEDWIRSPHNHCLMMTELEGCQSWSDRE